jgi:hypothetical protein
MGSGEVFVLGRTTFLYIMKCKGPDVCNEEEMHVKNVMGNELENL